MGSAPARDETWRLAAVGRLRQLIETAEVALVREGVERGLPGESAWSPHDWMTRVEGEFAPAPEVGHVARVLRVAQASGSGRVPVGGAPAEDGGGEEPEGVGAVAEAFASGDLPLGRVDQLVRFEAQVRRVADPDLVEGALATLLEGARDDVMATGPGGRGPYERVRGLAGKELGAAITHAGRLLRPEEEIEDEERRARAGRSLVTSPGPAGLSAYRVLLDAEGAAVLDSALAALSAPVTGPDGRRMPCDAGIVPVVLGGDSEVLDLGRTVRWFTPGQKKAIRLRDRGCTFPGCTMLPQWCDAHHVDWWCRGGVSDVTNGTLLCERHHTHVHQDDLTATITATSVTWHP